MSPRAYLVERETKTRGRVWHVRYKPRGATTPIHWGAYPSKRLAERARDYVNGELAVGRYPDPHAIQAPPERLTVLAAYDRWVDTHPNPTDSMAKQHRQVRGALAGTKLAGLLVDQVTAADYQQWIHTLAGRLAPSTIRQYQSRVKSALEHHDAQIRWDRVNIPIDDDEDDVNPPSWETLQAIAAAITPRHLPVLLFLERHGLRAVEVANLEIGDLDLAGRRIRVRRTKRRTGGRRFVPLVGTWAEWLDQHHLPPLEDRTPEARVFPAFNANTFRGAVARACRDARVEHYPPHQMRHRYITLMLLAGVDPAIVSKIAGHRKRSITLDIYGHILLDEPQWRLDELRAGASWVSGLTNPPTQEANVPANRVLLSSMGDTGL